MRAKPHLDRLLSRFDKTFLQPDPLAAVDGTLPPDDLEAALLIAAMFAYGRAELIQSTVSRILKNMGSSPASFCDTFIPAKQASWMKGFVYRFNKRGDLTALVMAIGTARRENGSLKNLFLKYDDPDAKTILPGLSGFAFAMREYGGSKSDSFNYLLADPAKGGACKRWNLFLRWMIRKDTVDPGPWAGSVARSRLIIPLDTHVGRIARALGALDRKSNDMKAALELTRYLRKLDPEDPVKYDFAICSYGKLGYCAKKINPEKCDSCDLGAICSSKPE